MDAILDYKMAAIYSVEYILTVTLASTCLALRIYQFDRVKFSGSVFAMASLYPMHFENNRDNTDNNEDDNDNNIIIPAISI